MSGHPAGSKEYWHEKYLNQNTPWDLDGPHPSMEVLYKEIRKLSHNNPLKVYVPGMGNGHDAAFFAQKGHPTVGGDLSEKAVQNAKTKYKTLKNIEFKVLDAITDSHPNKLDLVFDRAMFCALPAFIENHYLESCTQKLNDTGLFASILFTKVESENGPPWEISVEDFSLKMKALGYKLDFQKDVPLEYESSFIIHESIVVFSK